MACQRLFSHGRFGRFGRFDSTDAAIKHPAATLVTDCATARALKRLFVGENMAAQGLLRQGVYAFAFSFCL
jgi:hypothetical protein